MTQESFTEHVLSDVRECAGFFGVCCFFCCCDRSSLSAPVFSDASEPVCWEMFVPAGDTDVVVLSGLVRVRGKKSVFVRGPRWWMGSFSVWMRLLAVSFGMISFGGGFIEETGRYSVLSGK